MGEEIFQVDAFTDTPFRGNPAAVCILTESREEGWMQNVAGEMNLSETAFLWKKDDGYSLRWFTPSIEIDLCGHATLASAHVLWESGQLETDRPARFYTRSGILTAEKKEGLIELDFPAEPEDEVAVSQEIVSALGVTTKYAGKNRFDYLLEVESEDVLRNIKPDFALLGTIPVRGVIVTSISASKDYDFISRFLAPAVGINEDPVTGSAHCCLGPFWRKRLKKDRFTACQASSRGGVVHLRLKGNRVHLGGKAVTIFKGRLS
jgi:PhzF family phenazine biosynthesis protein